MLDQWKFLLQGELVSNHQSPVNDQCWGSERLLKSHDRIHPLRLRNVNLIYNLLRMFHYNIY